jgi:molybdenum cofactor cytidylyltransferase
MSDATRVSSAAPAQKIGAILLAAGESRRLGQPKQLLHYDGRPLITRAAETLLSAGISPVVVVLGAHAEKIRPALAGLPVILAENSAWPEGMGSSIRTGITALETAAPALDAALVALCDQPHFSRAAIDALRAALNGSLTIAATRHAESAGVPAIFRREHFPELRALNGAEGARNIIAAHLANVARIDLPELAIDIDTAADWARLSKR